MYVLFQEECVLLFLYEEPVEEKENQVKSATSQEDWFGRFYGFFNRRIGAKCRRECADHAKRRIRKINYYKRKQSSYQENSDKNSVHKKPSPCLFGHRSQNIGINNGVIY